MHRNDAQSASYRDVQNLRPPFWSPKLSSLRDQISSMPPLPGLEDGLASNLPPNVRRIYDVYVLPAEKDAIRAGDERRIMHIRVLGALLIHGPNDIARGRVAEEVATAMGDFSDSNCRVSFDRLSRLGELYYNHFICPCERSRSR